jgi:hypothetical protein
MLLSSVLSNMSGDIVKVRSAESTDLELLIIWLAGKPIPKYVKNGEVN